MSAEIVFINHPLETFTPTSSGALATIIWECCRAGELEGAEPTVITRKSGTVPMYLWPNTVSLEYPAIPGNSFLVKALRVQRKLTGWNHLRHKAYAVRVAKAIAAATNNETPLVLINDPEMVIYLHGRFPARHIVHWFENQQEARSRVQRDYAKCASVTCGVSNYTSRWVGDYYGISAVPTLYNGVDSEQFSPTVKPLEGLPFINFVGRTGIEKAPDLLLKAALEIADSVTNKFGLQLVGSNHWDRFEMDDYQRELGGYVDRLTAKGIEVRRPGHVGRAELPNHFRRSHIHVVPSRWDEPFGLTTVEGMATGLATIGSNTGGTPEVIGDNAMLFERDSVSGLASCLAHHLTNVEARLESGRRARERALHFNWRRTWKELKGLAGV
jgi:glycosyltransferase involved in cell wall biosynthesis